MANQEISSSSSSSADQEISSSSSSSANQEISSSSSSSANQEISSSSPSSSSSSWTYDVFLSFRGEDTRKAFTDHLYNALCGKGINTFIDNDLPRGEEISPQLVKAIEESRISIIVFSENYASSRWCLDELVEILRCKGSRQQMVRPIFYKVDPSHVRKQTNSYGDALIAYEEGKYKDKVVTWRNALAEAANLSGWPFKEEEYESKFINKVVDEISLELLHRTHLNLPEHLVGMQSYVQDVSALLRVGGEGRRMVGIWGTAGVGKTTIAKAVYNSIAHTFDSSCFLANVRESSMQHRGVIQLQKTLLSEILRDKTLKVNNVDRGVSVIKQRLCHKKVLLILDDVNKMEQLNNLAGCGWFAEGSRVIITTQNKDLLSRHGVESIYEVKKLDDQQALELLSWNAFERNETPNEYLELAKRSITYAQHLPLALTLLGSHLRNENMDRWSATLDSYEGDPFAGIQKTLRICYEGLSDHEKEVFLDIACFFKGKDRDSVKQMLKGHNLKDPEKCIQVLIQKAIIYIEYDRIWMHDLLEQMGKTVVYEESPREPGKRSRLWFHEDIRHVLTENTGTTRIKGILLKFPKPCEIHLNAKSFSGMKNLEFLIIRNACLSGDAIDYLSNKLKLIDWKGCQLQSLPPDFHPKELIKFHMPGSRIRQLWEGPKSFINLTSLNFKYCGLLTKIPDLSGAPNIEYMDLDYCTSLVEVDSSVGFLYKLKRWSLYACLNLTKFPTRINLKSLNFFQLSGCERLEYFPEIVDKMEFLQYLYLVRSGITELPPSIAYLTGLVRIQAYQCENLLDIPLSSLSELQKLRMLDFSWCPKLFTNQNIGNFEHGFNGRESQVYFLGYKSELKLCGNNFVSLPACISKFINLGKLELFGCRRLREIPELPPKLSEVLAANCKSLEKFPKLQSVVEKNDPQGLERLVLINCHRLCANYGFDDLTKMLELNQSSGFEIVFPGSEVPKWFSFCQDSYRCKCLLPSHVPNRLATFHDPDKCRCQVNLLHPWVDVKHTVNIKLPRNLVWEKSRLALCAVFEIHKHSPDLGFHNHVNFCVEFRINGELVDTFGVWPCLEEVVTDSTHVWLMYTPTLDKYQRKVRASSHRTHDDCEVTFCRRMCKGSACNFQAGVHLLFYQLGNLMLVNNVDFLAQNWAHLLSDESSSSPPMSFLPQTRGAIELWQDQLRQAKRKRKRVKDAGKKKKRSFH